MSRLCLVEDDPIMGESLMDRFRLEGIEATWCHNAEEAEQALSAGAFGAVVCDIGLPGVHGDRLFERLKGSRPVVPPFIFITGYGDIERAVELLKAGAADYVTKPFDLDQLLDRVRELVGHAAGEDAGELGVSPAMQRIDAVLRRIAPLDATILITGETGTGKEVVARRLHELSGRGPFIAVNCAALAEGLAESELFGHERGAFTGAAQRHAGVFERASGGTLLLDEIGDMPLPLQAKLLRVLQEGSATRVGGGEPVAFNTRVVLATHQNLRGLVARGAFREDLYFRINVLEINIPPLRDRRQDIPWLAERFLEQCTRRAGTGRRALAPDAVTALQGRDWPGNVRELRHALERACIFATGDRLHADALDPESWPAVHEEPPPRTLETYLAACERDYIAASLEAHGGRVGDTAEALGISRKSLWERMKRLAIER